MSVLTNALFIAVFCGGVLYISYKLYGVFLVKRVFGFDDSRVTPAVEMKDGVDFVPTRPSVLFGHHFASIAGLGPIIGPAIAVYWGWLPAIVWVLAGCILIGGVHDTAALFASIRHKARSIGDLTNEIMGGRARLLFLIIIFFLLALAMGVFAIVMANLFNDLSPQAVVPTFSLIAIAMIIGLLVTRRGWSLGRVTLVGLAAMGATLYAGLELPVPLYKAFITEPQVSRIIATTDDPDFPTVHGIRATRAGLAQHYFEERAKADASFEPLAADVKAARDSARSTWVYILLAYAFAASVLPVWLLLQPRDYLNCFQLYIGLGLLVLGLLVWRPDIQAPAFGAVAQPPSAVLSQAGAAEPQAPPVLPFIFITIACGAVSGFHNLVSSGTTARQMRRETDAHVIGYGAMLMEGFLAVLVILACVAGLSRADFQNQYGHWGGLDARALGAFLDGAAAVAAQPFLWIGSNVGIVAQVSNLWPHRLETGATGSGAAGSQAVTLFCRNFIAVMVVSFAMTTLDSATRLLRYNVEELAKLARFKPLANRYTSSLVAVAAIGYFALMKIDGRPAGLTLWQLFGTTNQLLAALGLLVASVYLYQLRKPVIYTLLPMLVMVASVSWAMSYKLAEFYNGWRTGGDLTNLSLLIVGSVLAAMAAWMVVEAIGAFRRTREKRATDLEQPAGTPAATGVPKEVVPD